jgi:type II secretion system protein H
MILRPIKARRGFTLIELVIVLSVLVIAAAVILPGFPAFSRSQHLRNAADRLAGMARYAGDWSVLHERALDLAYDEKAQQFTLSVAEELVDELLAAPLPEESEAIPQEAPRIDSAFRVLSLPKDVKLHAGQVGEEQFGSAGRLRFFPDGRCEDAILVLSAGKQQYTVRISGRRGRVTVEHGNALEADGNA